MEYIDGAFTKALLQEALYLHIEIQLSSWKQFWRMIKISRPSLHSRRVWLLAEELSAS